MKMAIADILSIIVGVLALIVAGFAAVYARKQAQQASRARDISALLPLYQTHESPDFTGVRRMIHDATVKHKPIKPEDLEDQDKEPLKLPLRAYINHLNFVSIMAYEGLVNKAYARTIFSTPIINCLDYCDDYINDVRQENPLFALYLPELGRQEAPLGVIKLVARALGRDPSLRTVRVSSDGLVLAVATADGNEEWEVKVSKLT